MFSHTNDLLLREPQPTDGAPVFELISICPPLDTNSMYCNLLQCTHFATTSVVAEKEGELVGFISGYLKPENQNCLFIWQVAVAESARGTGLATKMIQHMLARPKCSEVQWLETTITPDNHASWALFEGIAHKKNTQVSKQILFDQTDHFHGAHDSEYLVQIGPFSQNESQPGSCSAGNATTQEAAQ